MRISLETVYVFNTNRIMSKDLFKTIQDCLNEAPDGQWIDVHKVIDEYGVNEANWIKKQDGKLFVLIITSEYDRLKVKAPKDFDSEEWWWHRLWIEWEIPKELITTWHEWHDEQIINRELVSVYDLWAKLARHITNDEVIIFNEGAEVI